jgi:hypothetical protein
MRLACVAILGRILYSANMVLACEKGWPMKVRVVCFVLALGALYLFLSAAPAAAQMQPGLWRFSQSTDAGNNTKARAKVRTACLTPAQAEDAATYFQPRGRDCVLVQHSRFGTRLTSQIRCTQGGATSDISSTISLASPTQLSITTTVVGTRGGQTVSARMQGEGQRLGDCGGGRRKRG